MRYGGVSGLFRLTVTIPEIERDPDLSEKLKEELPGVWHGRRRAVGHGKPKG